VSHISNFAA